MQIIRLFSLLLILALSLPAFGQSDTLVTTPQKDTLSGAFPQSPDTKAIAVKDSSATIKEPGKKKEPVVVKDAARLALEKLPGQAARRSAILPGYGQIKNGRWWKAPFIYGGFVGAGLVFEFNQRYYKKMLDERQFRYHNPGKKSDKELEPYDEQALRSAQDYYRRNRDLSILAGTAVYAINIIDAYVDAKFFRYDINDELSIRYGPSIEAYAVHASIMPVAAFKIKLIL